MRSDLREELVQDVLANCLEAYARLVKRGRADLGFPSALCRYAVAQVHVGRRVGCKLRIREVLSSYAQHNKGFRVERLDHFDEQEGCWQEIVVEDKRATPADIAACRMDFSAWLQMLPRRERKIALALAGGETTNDASKKFGLSPGRISQLRQWLKESWEGFQGEAVIASSPQLAAA